MPREQQRFDRGRRPVRDEKEIARMREERYKWAMEHDTKKDPICSKNSLDVCIDYNNKYRDLH